jgi:hypothetical protein
MKLPKERTRMVIAFALASIVMAGSLVYIANDLLWGPKGMLATSGHGAPNLAEPLKQDFPRMNRSPMLYVINVSEATFDEKLTMVSLQGLVNRRAAALYLDYGTELWLDFLNKTYGQAWTRISMEEALRKYSSVPRGLVVYDPKVPATVNVATNFCARDGLVMASPDMLSWVETVTNLTVKVDLREGDWASPTLGYGIYMKVLTEFYPSMRQDIISILQPGRPYLRDYLIANGIMLVEFNPGPLITPDQEEFNNALLDLTPKARTVFGWYDDPTGVEENLGTQRLSAHYKVLLPADLLPNLSVYAAYDFKQKPEARTKVGHQAPSLEDKVYLTFAFSDGDNLAFMHNKLTSMWASPVRGTQPFGWSISPVAQEVAPPLFEYYTSTMTKNDTLICGTDGAGVFYPDFLPQEDLGPMLARTRQLMDSAGLDSIWLVNSYTAHETPYSTRSLGAYADYLEPAGVFLDYGDVPVTRPYWIGGGKEYNGVPYARATHMWDDKNNFIAKVLVARDTVKTRPFFIFSAVHVWSMSPEDVLSVIQALNATEPDSDFKLVSPLDFLALIQESQVQVARDGLDSLDQLPYALVQNRRADIIVEVDAAEKDLNAGKLDSAAAHATKANVMISAIRMDVVTVATVLFTMGFAAMLYILLYFALKRRKPKTLAKAREGPPRSLPAQLDLIMVYASACAAFLAFFRVLYSYFWNWPAVFIGIGISFAFLPLLTTKRYKALDVRERLIAGNAIVFLFGLGSLLTSYVMPASLFGLMMVLEASPSVRKGGVAVVTAPMVLAMLTVGLTRYFPLASLVSGAWALALGATMPLGSGGPAPARPKTKAPTDAPTPPTLFLVIALMAFYIPSSRYLSLKTGDLQGYLWNLFIIIPLGALAIAYPFAMMLWPAVNARWKGRGKGRFPPGAVHRGSLTALAALAYGSLLFTTDPIALSALILLGQVFVTALALVMMPKDWLPVYSGSFSRDFVLLFGALNLLFLLPAITYTVFITKLGISLNYLLYTFPISFAIGLCIMIVPVALYRRD